MGKPIFIVGCPRSGTTITLKILALHEQLSWIPGCVDKSPRETQKAFRNRAYSIPFLGKHIYHFAMKQGNFLSRKIKRYLPFPVEPWSFWKHYLNGFLWNSSGNTPPRSMGISDISEQEVIGVRKAVDSIQKAQGKDNFLSKYTDFPRMTYLMKAFPDAVFVHVVRDGRAVSASYFQKINSGGFSAWNKRDWWISGWPEEWQNEWENSSKSKLSFSAYQYKFFMREIANDVKKIPLNRCYEVNYADIIESPIETFKDIIAFCELDSSRNIEWYLKSIELTNMNHKWITGFSDSEKAELNGILSEPELRVRFDDSCV